MKNIEILIIDNGSSDDTRALVLKYQEKYNIIKYHYESVIGLSRARSTGARLASYEYIAYIDDDGKVSPNFLNTVLSVIMQFNFDMFGRSEEHTSELQSH